MCRNIKALFNFDPPATDAEVRDAAVQFVRKISGMHTPVRGNEATFNKAVDQVSDVCRELLDSLHTNAQPKNREVEAAKARERSAARFSR